MRTSIKLSLISILVILIFYVSLDVGNLIFKIIPPDSLSYIDASNMLYNEMLPHPTRPLGYAFISGLPNLIYPNLSNNQYILFAVCLNLFSWIGSIILFNKSLKLYFTDKVSFLFTLFLIFTFGGIANIFWMLTESFIMLLLSLITYYILKYGRNKEIKYLIIASSLLNFAIMIKPGFIYLGIIASFLLVFFLIKLGIKNNSKMLISIFIISLGFVMFQYVAMYKVYDKATPSFIDKVTWYYYLGAESYADAERIPFDSVQESRRMYLSNKSYKEKSQICSEDLKCQIRENTYVVFKQWSLNIIENSISGSNFLSTIKRENNNTYISIFSGILYNIARLQNLFFMLVFFFSTLMILKNIFRYNIIIFLLATIVAYVILTSGISFGQGDRFHYILYPVIMVIFLLLIKDKAYAQQWLKRE
jgi:hypothetical protein